MTLVAHCIGLSDQELKKLDIKSNARIKIDTANQLTNIRAVGIYDDLIELLAIITTFKIFEVHLE